MLFDSPVLAPPEEVRQEWIDFNGHLNMAYYNVLFDHAVDHLFGQLGCGADYVERRKMSFFTAEAHVRYVRELHAEDMTSCTLQVVNNDAKRIHLYQELLHADGWLSATSETLLLHIDMTIRKVTAFPDDIRQKIEVLAAAHRSLPQPTTIGRGIALKPQQP
ncbi:thioesterase family protein [Rhizobium sp. EC-SD404]|uniref:thioesterase family protein n=1 Tax=Rhizobium sp. EC-SD404 TaxID=2038389 RepID=UPI00125C434D|nr:thioesterase family protein [Rhizobium sp. EC-SD404]VVT26084.1 (3S)-malyl-CoA thioesterase [Rhizobium sp. EC-SD404]